MFRRSFWTLILFVLLAACAPVATLFLSSPSAVDTASPVASPSSVRFEDSPTSEPISPTPEAASSTSTETATATESIPTETPTPFPTLDLSPTLTTTAIPQPTVEAGAIQIYAPGPLSKVISPLAFYGYAVPGYRNKGTMELYGEDGRLLASELLQLNTPYKWAYFSWSMSFEAEAVGELGRLTMSVKDQYDRTTALYSVHLLLLSQGASIINPSGDLRERCIIEQPATGKRTSGGGILTVSGKMRPYSAQPLTLELVKRDGRVIGSQMLELSPDPNDGYVPFSVDMPYALSSEAWVLLSVSQPDDRIPGTMYLYSQEIYMNP